MSVHEGPDFIVSELLSELREENVRKDKQIQNLHKTIIASVLVLLVMVCGFLIYLNQYDFVDYTAQTATGAYAIIDSDGNIVGQDLTADQIESILRSVSNG